MPNNKGKLFLALLIFFGAASVILRLLPHLPNFAPIGALALFAGLYATRKRWFFVPIAAMLVSDALIGFYQWPLMAVVYGSFLVYALIGRVFSGNKSFTTVLTGTFGGALFFYLATNFAVWIFSSWYPHTLQGLMWSYELALPFFRNALLGDLFYTGIFVGSYEAAMRMLPLLYQGKKYTISRTPLKAGV